MQRIKRLSRHLKLRKFLQGTSARPRLAVFRSNQHIYAQVIDDVKKITLAAASDLNLKNKASKAEMAFAVGKKLAEESLKIGVSQVVFDRGGFLYHGRVLKVAQGAREGGLKF